MSSDAYRRVFNNDRTIAMCLDGVFPVEKEERTAIIKNADEYLSLPKGGDFDQLLPYCTTLVQLSEFFELQKMKFIKLRYAFQFLLRLDGDAYFVTTSHQAETLVRVKELASMLSNSLETSMKMNRNPRPQLLQIADMEIGLIGTMFVDRLRAQFNAARKTIGLLFYCLHHIIPRATDTVHQLLVTSPLMMRNIQSYYNTLRATAAFLGALLELKQNGNHSGQVRLMQECIMIVDEIIRQKGNNSASTRADDPNEVMVTKFMLVLRATCIYEADLRCSKEMSFAIELRLAFFKRAEQKSIELTSKSMCTWTGGETTRHIAFDGDVLDGYRMSLARNPTGQSMIQGDDPLKNNIFLM